MPPTLPSPLPRAEEACREISAHDNRSFVVHIACSEAGLGSKLPAMGWQQQLPDDLLESAYRANTESAWNRQDAIRVVQVLSSLGYRILGVDIWLPTDPGPTIPTPFVYDWTCRADTPSKSYPLSAEEFIRSFDWHPSDESHLGMEPYFNIPPVRRQSE